MRCPSLFLLLEKRFHKVTEKEKRFRSIAIAIAATTALTGLGACATSPVNPTTAKVPYSSKETNDISSRSDSADIDTVYESSFNPGETLYGPPPYWEDSDTSDTYDSAESFVDSEECLYGPPPYWDETDSWIESDVETMSDLYGPPPYEDETDTYSEAETLYGPPPYEDETDTYSEAETLYGSPPYWDETVTADTEYIPDTDIGKFSTDFNPLDNDTEVLYGPPSYKRK